MQITPTTTQASWQKLILQFNTIANRLPEDVVLFLARFGLAAVFWLSGQTKVQNFEIDLVHGIFKLGWPALSDTALELFRDEYKLPLLDPALAATMAALGEHFLPILLLLGFATRFAALGLLGMTAVIQLFVYPGAYPTHATWAALLLLLLARGGGRASIDYWIKRRYES